MSGVAVAAGQWPADYQPTLRAPALLRNPSLRFCLDLHLEASLPWTLPVDLSMRPLRVSHDEVTVRVTPGVPADDRHYTRRMLDVSGLYDEAPDLFGIVPDVHELRVVLGLTDPHDLRPWADLRRVMQQEVRGKFCAGHLYDVTSQELTENVFVGYLAHYSYDRHTIELLLTADDPGKLTDLLALQVERHFPNAPERDRGTLLARGVGVGRYVPARCTSGRTDETTLVQRVFTVDAGTDAATITAHGLGEGDGPFRVSSTGTLPGGLEDGVDYYLAETTADTFLFATQPTGDELDLVDLTDTGTGTHTLTSGVAPQIDDHWDHDVWGTCSVHEVFQSGEKALPSEYTIYRTLHRVLGRYCTTVRFRDDPGPVTLHLERTHPDATDAALAWFWDQGFGASLGSLDFTPGVSLGDSGLTTAALCPGPSGIGLGAVALNGSGEYLEAPTAPQPTTFTCAVWWWWDGANGTWVDGPGSLADAVDCPSWTIAPRADGRLFVAYRYGYGGRFTFVTPIDTLVRRGWNSGVFVMTPAGLRFYANAVKHGESDLPATFPLVYGPTDAGLLLGADMYPGDGWGGGKAGPLWYLPGVAWSDREAALFHWRMLRNPVEADRELERDFGETPDATSYDAATLVAAAVVNGGLRCDGWVDEPLALSDYRQRLAPFRQFQWGRTGTGAVTLRVASPAPEGDDIVASFGLGDDVSRNIVELRGGAPSSLAEADQFLPISYRPTRDAVTGALQGFQHSPKPLRPIHVVGAANRTLPLWFVYDSLTADIIADFRSKLRKTRDDLLQITVGHEGRHVRASDVVRVRIPDVGIDLMDVVVLRAVRSTRTTDLDVVPYRAADFEYEPRPLPPEPPMRALTRLDLGDAALVLVGREGAAVTLRVDPRVTATVLPDGPSSLTQGTLTGGATHHAVLGDGSDATYVEMLTSGIAFVGMANPALPTPTGVSVTVTVRARELTTGAVQIGVRLSGVAKYAGGIQNLTGSFADYTATWTTSPFTGLAWTLAELNALEAGASMSNGRLARVQLVATCTLDVSAKLGRVQWRRTGPTATDPGILAESAPVHAVDTALQLVDHIDDTPGNEYWYQADVYDNVGAGRLVAQLGTLHVEVP